MSLITLQLFWQMIAHMDIHDWLNLLVRWAHVITGIMWIGSSFYFVWLDANMEKPKTPKKGVEGELWMVHSGGFYQVEKRLIEPGDVPANLHWFKWEATFTWVTGFMLLWIVYYTTGGIYLIDPSIAKISANQGTLIGLGLLVFSWFFYDILFRSKLANSKAATVIALAFVAATSFGLSQVFSGRATYLHIGAMFGTWMVLNVWVHILPSQQKMIDATQAGKTPDYNLGKKAKNRSMHNSYMTLPVLFIMVSNHYPATYGNKFSWIVLLLLIFMGAMVRDVMITKKKGPLVPAFITLFILMLMTASVPAQSHSDSTLPPIPNEKIIAIVQTRCLSCHSSHATDDVFKVAPNGVVFDDFSVFTAYAARIRERVISLKTMPLANKTNMTDEERTILEQWLNQLPH